MKCCLVHQKSLIMQFLNHVAEDEHSICNVCLFVCLNSKTLSSYIHASMIIDVNDIETW